DKLCTESLSAAELENLRAPAVKQGPHDLAKAYEEHKAAAEVRERPKNDTPSGLHTRASQALSKIKQLEKRLHRELDRQEPWRAGALVELEKSTQELAIDLDSHESKNKEVVLQISNEVHA
ncbi:unnamed protein product, partial [Prorocentrum cordatum]